MCAGVTVSLYEGLIPFFRACKICGYSARVTVSGYYFCGQHSVPFLGGVCFMRVTMSAYAKGKILIDLPTSFVQIY